jgi:hypothetical protein
MMGTLPGTRQPALFSYHIDLEHRVGADHLLRRVSTTLDLGFVIPTVRDLYGRSGNVSLDPRVIVKLLLLLFLYDVPSERELMEQVALAWTSSGSWALIWRRISPTTACSPKPGPVGASLFLSNFSPRRFTNVCKPVWSMAVCSMSTARW